MNRYLDILKEYWGYDAFRGVQAEIIESIGSGRDTLGLMPTGGGKSICFQVPALAMEGVCLVVTPLISLMKDQVRQLRNRGVKADAVYSGMLRSDIVRVLDNAVLGGCQILYLSPERLSSELFIAKLQRMRKVSMIVVDEAHCVSQWGYDFRPSYLQIAEIRRLAPNRAPVLALTATATPKVVDDIQEKLEFEEKNVFSMSFERKNLIYVVRECQDKASEMLKVLRGVPQGGAIVYTRTRQQTADVARFLVENGLTASSYHAGLTNAEKDFRQAAWVEGHVRVMVATNAFGMGIDKPDVRVVVHLSMPDSLEAYFQEAGRAGRDGKSSYAVLLYNDSDDYNLSRRIKETYPEPDYIKQTYENVCYFLQVGIGESLGRTYYFSMEKFCKLFKQFPVQTNSALQLLNNAGYIEYREEREYKSALRFVLRKEELYRLYETDANTDLLIQAILRNYTGVFADYVYIEETNLSHITGLSVEIVYMTLKQMSHNGIISFIPHRKTPTVGFTVARVDPEQIWLPDSVYKDRIEDMKMRTKEMLDYASSKDRCRSSILLRYFGQKDVVDCGQCDVCLARRKDKRLTVNRRSAREEIVEILNDGEYHLLADLQKQLTADVDALSAAMQALVEEGCVRVDGAKIRLIK